MFQLVLAWKSQNANSAPEVIYVGNSGDDRVAAVKGMAGKGYVRAQLYVNPIGAPVQIPETAAEIIKRTEEANKAVRAAIEKEKQAQVAAAERDIADAQRRLEAMKNPLPAPPVSVAAEMGLEENKKTKKK